MSTENKLEKVLIGVLVVLLVVSISLIYFKSRVSSDDMLTSEEDPHSLVELPDNDGEIITEPSLPEEEI